MPAELIYERPWMYPQQLAAIFCPERYAVIEASTKSGKTAGSIVWLAEQAMAGRAGQNYWWVAPVRDQAEDAFERMRQAFPREILQQSDAAGQSDGRKGANETKLRLILPNRANLWFKSGEKPDTLYGKDVYAAVIDEASRLRDAAWHAVRSTLTATKGPLRIIGNVKGRKNWFYRLARIAETGTDPTMHYARITAADAIAAGVLDAAEVADAHDKLPAAVYRELYEAQPSDDQGNPFGLDAIRAVTVAGLSAGPPMIWGIDLAKSIDFTVLIALDAAGHVCRFERFQKPWRECIETIQHLVGDVPAVVDASGVGDPIVETLQRGTRTVLDPQRGPQTVPAYGRFEGFKFTSASKQMLMEQLAVAIQQRQIRIPIGPIVTELEAFEYVYDRLGVRYSAPPGVHDDCVIGLALAVSKFQRIDRHTGDEWLRLFRLGDRPRVGTDRDTGSGLYADDDNDAIDGVLDAAQPPRF